MLARRASSFARSLRNARFNSSIPKASLAADLHSATVQMQTPPPPTAATLPSTDMATAPPAPSKDSLASAADTAVQGQGKPYTYRKRALTDNVRALPLFSMQDRVSMITGAARGLGWEFCKAFIGSGCTQLAIVDLNKKEAEESAKELVNFACGNVLDAKPSDYDVIGIECDVSSERSVQRAYQNMVDHYGRVDSVVASAGIVENYSSMDYPFDRIKRLYDINVHGAFFTAREAARIMTAQGGGTIVLVSSMSANIVNVPQAQTPYNASKAAVKHMAASLGVEWAQTGVRINVLSPGYMLTKLTARILEDSPHLKSYWESMTPMGRMGDPEDLSGAVVFLASDASSFMTGAEVRVDGGYCIV